MAPKAQGSTRSPPQPAHPAKDVEKHWAKRALTLSLAGEASSAVAEFLGGLTPGLLQKLTALLMLCAGGADLGYFLVYRGTDISSAVCFFKPEMT